MGVDRFYVYNGGVKVLPNDKNVNWLFDNINYEQRQKVWATKVPRYNEIWFFYPRGSATECTDAVIYNTKDLIWYDAGSAVGAQRSCGYTTEIFPSPIWCDWNFNAIYSQGFSIVGIPSGYPDLTNYQFYLAGDQTQVFSPGDSLSFSNTGQPVTYRVITSEFQYDSGTNPPPGTTLITVTTEFNPLPDVGNVVYVVDGGYDIWQHEFGLNRVTNAGEIAITSSVTTSDISWIGGTPSGDSPIGVNRRMHLRRVEPNFLQDGVMGMTVLGKKFAGSALTEDSGPYLFNQDTGKIDLRVEHRLVRLKFESNDIDGNYEMGRNIITAEYGDERP
jgi:hypothetical protein